jgi:predicted nucleotidyltransferase
MISSQPLISKLSEELEQDPQILLAFLFGSYAGGTARANSDLDIAVYFQDGYVFKDIQTLWSRIEKISGKEVDLIVLNTAPPTICWAALQGVALTIKDDRQYLEYMLDCSREAEDFREFVFDLYRLRQELRGNDHSVENIIAKS